MCVNTMELSNVDLGDAQNVLKKLRTAQRFRAYLDAGDVLQLRGSMPPFPDIARCLHRKRTPARGAALQAKLRREIETVMRAFDEDVVQCAKTMLGKALPTNLSHCALRLKALTVEKEAQIQALQAEICQLRYAETKVDIWKQTAALGEALLAQR